MTSGGARNRSGPARDPNSGRSDRLGVSFTALPAGGFAGEMPKYPLMKNFVWNVYFVDKERHTELDEAATEQRWERENELWEWAWRTPQAAAWEAQQWRWHSVAMWVRTAVICESSDATAADKNSLHRFADQIGLTPAGLKENGWAIAADEVGARRTEASESSEEVPRPRRLSAVKDA